MHKSLQSLQLSLLNIGLADLDSNWNYDNVVSPFTRLYYITKGAAKVYHNNQVFDLKPGYMYLIPSYTYSQYKCDAYHQQYYISFLEELKNGLSIYNFKHFKYEVKATEIDLYYFKRLLAINPKRSYIDDNPEVYDNRASLLNFKAKNERLSTNAYLETQGILSILLSKFIKHQNITRATNTISINTDLSNVLSYINENLHEHLTVKKLALYCNLSTDYFSKIFNTKFGMRPNKYIQSKRIERAQLLLLTTSYSLKQIALKVGIESLPYFSRIFKNSTGETPANFRNRA